MSRLIDNITEQVGNLTPAYGFFHGSPSEQNVKADNLTDQAVFLNDVVNGGHTFTVNKLVRTLYTVTLSFLSKAATTVTVAENQTAVDAHQVAAWELLRRLSALEDDKNRLVILTQPTNITTESVYHRYDNNWVGIQMTVTLELYEDFTTCVT